jgi:CubicO group peptidase (beta-lactamase class C family)
MCPTPEAPAVRRVPALDALAARVVSLHRAAPCAVVACAWRSTHGWQLDEGAAGQLVPGGPLADPDTVFDLASVTKPLVAVALARCARIGALTLATPTGSLVQEARGGPTERVPLELLLAHRGGLEGHRPLYAPLERGERSVERSAALAEAAAARLPHCRGEPPAEGFAPTYSDLGYMLLGEAMARAVALPLDELVSREVCQPLALHIGSSRQCQARCAGFDRKVAPTEIVSWRGGCVRGVVHDENAWALASTGMCGHAGLFAPAREVAAFGAALLDALAGRRPDWLGPSELAPLLRPRPGGTLRAGFDGKSETGSSAGPCCSPGSFGHLGFTGNSLWLDPERSIAVVLLSNRVHPSRNNDAIKAARPDVNEALFQWALAQMGRAST